MEEGFVLSATTIDIWQISISQSTRDLGWYQELLSGEEISRSLRFYFQRDRERFIVTHGVMRFLLGKYLQFPPQGLIFQYSPIGKPYITHPDDIRFNLSHSHDLALLAFGLKRDIGVDIEYHRRDLATKEIAERFFSPSEVTSLLSIPKALQIEAFYNCWTRKEAYLKAKGKGLTIPLNSFNVNLIPGEPAYLINSLQDPEDVIRFSLWNIDATENYSAAVCVEGIDVNLRSMSWEAST